MSRRSWLKLYREWIELGNRETDTTLSKLDEERMTELSNEIKSSKYYNYVYETDFFNWRPYLYASGIPGTFFDRIINLFPFFIIFTIFSVVDVIGNKSTTLLETFIFSFLYFFIFLIIFSYFDLLFAITYIIFLYTSVPFIFIFDFLEKRNLISSKFREFLYDSWHIYRIYIFELFRKI